jgi:uncharacterized protein (DUF302 family)
MLYVKETTGSAKEVVERLEKAAAAHKFGVLGVHNLREKMAAKGVDFPHECLVVEVCNPMEAKSVLEANLEISTALPCRISVYEEAGRVKVATLQPTALLELFGNPELAPVAREVEETLVRIMDQACSAIPGQIKDRH